jgi:phosphatidylglycerophosphate synthase
VIANLLTALRLSLAAPVALAFAFPSVMTANTLLSLILLAMATDVADGQAARRFGTASSRGMLFDHVTDFIFVTSGLAGLAIAGSISPLLPLLIAAAFSQYVLDSYFLFKQKSLRMSILGRWNGVLYFFPLVAFSIAALAWLPTSLTAAVEICGKILVWILTLSTIASIVDRAIAPLRA